MTSQSMFNGIPALTFSLSLFVIYNVFSVRFATHLSSFNASSNPNPKESSLYIIVSFIAFALWAVYKNESINYQNWCHYIIVCKRLVYEPNWLFSKFCHVHMLWDMALEFQDTNVNTPFHVFFSLVFTLELQYSYIRKIEFFCSHKLFGSTKTTWGQQIHMLPNDLRQKIN